MSSVTQIDVPPGSLLAGFGSAADYRDCFAREVPGDVDLAQFIERFYCSMVFRPERLTLRLIGRGASNEDAARLAAGKADGIALWQVVERRETEILLQASRTGTASWLAVEALPSSSEALGPDKTPSSSAAAGQKTRLLFGSWVKGIDQSGWKAMLVPHVWYSRLLLGGV